MHKIKFEILSKQWTLRVLKKKRYKRTNGIHSVAVTDTTKRRIDIGPSGMDLETVTHELVHAYLTEICTKSADLENDQMEEICAELFSKRGRELLDIADRLYSEIMLATAAKIIT